MQALAGEATRQAAASASVNARGEATEAAEIEAASKQGQTHLPDSISLPFRRSTRARGFISVPFGGAEATPRFHFHPHARQPFDGMPPLAPRKRKAVAAARGRKKKERVAPDRISALPDEVLHLVLSLLPVHDAVATCVLARRWLHLWKEAPGLSVEWWDYDEPGDRFISLVDRFFTLRSSSAPLNYCSININFPEFLPEKEQLFVRWIQRALRCQARVLRISLIDWVELPNMTLISQHLTRLELQGISGDDNFLDLSGCPSLVNLNMDTCCIYVDKLSSSSLKTLCLSQCQFSIEYHIWLCFPSLVSLELSYCPGRAPFLESMPSLLQAIVRFDDACEDKCQKSVSGGCDDDDDNEAHTRTLAVLTSIRQFGTGQKKLSSFSLSC
jgi:hypothetical protein